jgi:hypothetical protein
MSSTIAVLEKEQHGRRNKCFECDPNEKGFSFGARKHNPA